VSADQSLASGKAAILDRYLKCRNEKRLTLMNVNRNPENSGFMQAAGRSPVCPTGDFVLGDVQDSLAKQTGLVHRVRRISCFPCGREARPAY